MNTTYGSKKQLKRLMAGSTQLLAILMSMLRVSLEAAWSMARVWLEYAYSIFITTFLRLFSSKRAELERRLTHNEITSRRIHAPDAHIRKWKCVGTRRFLVYSQ